MPQITLHSNPNNEQMSSPTLFDLTPYSKESIHHPDWEDTQGDDETTFISSHVTETSSHVATETSSHVATESSHVGVTCELNQPTCELIYQWVEVYPVKQENYYYRYSYIDKSSNIHRIVKHHIPGGNTTSPVAINRMAAIENAINSGAQPPEIEAMIKAWKKHTKVNGNK